MSEQLDINSWKTFKMSDIFKFTKGKRLTKENMIIGNLNYLGAISDNNGVRDHIEANARHRANCITVNYNGSVGEAFYQSEPFWATDDINILDLKEISMTENIGLFLCTVIKHNKYKFGYGRKWTLEKMKETNILLPTKNTHIDFEFMEMYIKNLNIKHVKTNIDFQPVKLNLNIWKKFYIRDIFNVTRSKNINSRELVTVGNIPYVTRTKYNNGVEKFVYDDEYKTNKGNAIIIGGESAIAFYQDKNFFTGNNITKLNNESLNKYNSLFIITLINKEIYKYSYGRAFNTKNVLNTLLLLPSTSDDKPDWEYMEQYIRSLPYADKI